MNSSYEEPKLVDHGSITELTLQTPKSRGGNDGFILVPDGTPLGNAS